MNRKYFYKISSNGVTVDKYGRQFTFNEKEFNRRRRRTKKFPNGMDVFTAANSMSLK